MTYLGLDLGSKTIGVAISESGIIAHTLTTLRFREDDYTEALKLTIKLIEEHQAKVIVLGLPKHMNNDIGIRGKISEDFSNELIKKGLNVFYGMKDYPQKLHYKPWQKDQKKEANRKRKKDELAAVLILQNYLDYKGANHVTR